MIAFVFLLTGCSAAQTFEKVEDTYNSGIVAQAEKPVFALPEDACAQVMKTEQGTLYFCEGYEIMVQTMTSGDMDATLKALTGYKRESLTLLETGVDSWERYECVWTSAGEAGDQVGRAVIIDDGNYHYCLSVMAHAQDAGSLQESWQELFSSFSLQS